MKSAEGEKGWKLVAYIKDIACDCCFDIISLLFLLMWKKINVLCTKIQTVSCSFLAVICILYSFSSFKDKKLVKCMLCILLTWSFRKLSFQLYFIYRRFLKSLFFSEIMYIFVSNCELQLVWVIEYFSLEKDENKFLVYSSKMTKFINFILTLIQFYIYERVTFSIILVVPFMYKMQTFLKSIHYVSKLIVMVLKESLLYVRILFNFGLFQVSYT